MQTFKTTKGEVIKISSNKSERRFIIKISGGTYKTNRMSENEFYYCLNSDGNDWKYFLKNRSENYNKID